MFQVPIYHEGVLVGFATVWSNGSITFELPATQASRDLVQLLLETHWNSFEITPKREL